MTLMNATENLIGIVSYSYADYWLCYLANLKASPDAKLWWVTHVDSTAVKVNSAQFLDVLVIKSELLGAVWSKNPAELRNFWTQVVDMFIKRSVREELVSIRDFNLFSVRFGPLSTCARLLNTNFFLNNTICPWFHGCDIKNIATVGGWLVRLSSTYICPLLLFHDANNVLHQCALFNALERGREGKAPFYMDTPIKYYATYAELLGGSRLRDKLVAPVISTYVASRLTPASNCKALLGTPYGRWINC